MAQINTSTWAADLAAMIADLPATATAAFLNGSVSVSIAELTSETALILTGDNSKKAFACVLPQSATTAVPKAQQRISITRPGESGPTNYQINRLRAPADGIAYELVLIQDVRGP